MKNRNISKKDFKLMKKELDFFEDKNIITDLEKSKMINFYEIKEKHDFVKLVLIIGSILLGIGILSFIAANWMNMSKLFKFILIVFSLIGVNFTGYRLETPYPKTSISFYYLGILIYGAGIFLIGQAFNLGGEFPTAFLLWAIGIIGIGIYLKDRIILIFSVILLLIYSNIYYFQTSESLPIISILLIPLFYSFNKRINYNKIYIFFINLLSLNLLILILLNILPNNHQSIITLFILFFIGLIMYYYKSNSKTSEVINIQGGLIHWITGLMLTFPGFLSTFSDTYLNVFLGVFYFIFALFLMNKGSLLSIFIVCSIVLRFYVDLSYDRLPQSLVFIISGLILLGFGFYFERQRRKGGEF